MSFEQNKLNNTLSCNIWFKLEAPLPSEIEKLPQHQELKVLSLILNDK